MRQQVIATRRAYGRLWSRVNLSFCIAALPAIVLISAIGNAQPQASEPLVISVDVNLVLLNATVSDPKGGFPADLRQQEFSIYEDGVPQAIRLFRHEDTPVTVGLVVDHSGSMRHRIAEVAAAASTFAAASSPRDEMFVVNFNEHVTYGLPAGTSFSNRPDELAFAIASKPTTGQTALYDAVFAARERLSKGSHDKKVLIVISDGGDNASRHSLDELMEIARHSNVAIYTIGIFEDEDPDKNPAALRRLSLATGGEAYFPKELKRVVSICERIAQDIRHQYTIGYVSNKADAKHGVYRSIRVTATSRGRGKLVVRTRTGYVPESTPALGKQGGTL
jgi:Ca-activated chloride channel family protein